MTIFANLKIQLKIILLLAALGLVTLGVAWYGGSAIKQADDSYSEIVGETMPDTVKLVRANRVTIEMIYAAPQEFFFSFPPISLDANGTYIAVIEQTSLQNFAGICQTSAVPPEDTYSGGEQLVNIWPTPYSGTNDACVDANHSSAAPSRCSPPSRRCVANARSATRPTKNGEMIAPIAVVP